MGRLGVRALKSKEEFPFYFRFANLSLGVLCLYASGKVGVVALEYLEIQGVLLFLFFAVLGAGGIVYSLPKRLIAKYHGYLLGITVFLDFVTNVAAVFLKR